MVRKGNGITPMDLTGRRFGKLVVLKEVERTKDGKYRRWLCRCDCGNETIVRQQNLTAGYIIACGCMKGTRKRKIEFPCPYPYHGCADSRNGLCCHDCDNKTVCEDLCLNDPHKCGRFKGVQQ